MSKEQRVRRVYQDQAVVWYVDYEERADYLENGQRSTATFETIRQAGRTERIFLVGYGNLR